MTKEFEDTFQRLFNHPQFSSVRYEIWKRDASRDSRAATVFARQANMAVANIFTSPILDSTQSKTLFILGSGWSINSLSDENISHMGSHESVGINFWFFHDFVPSLFSFDAGKVDDSEKPHLRESLTQLGKLFSRPAIVEKNPKVLYLRPFQGDTSLLIPIPKSLSAQAWVHGRANFISRTAHALEADIRDVLSRLIDEKLPPTVLPDNGSSVARLVFLALAQGFRDIVLVGVDLDAKPHFWFAPSYVEKYGDYVRLFPKPDNQPHGTTLAINRPTDTLDFLTMLNLAITDLGLGQIWAGSSESHLSSRLEPYRWPSYDPDGSSAAKT